MSAEYGLMGEGDHVLARIGGNELLEERAVDFCTVSGQVASLGIAPRTAGPERRDFGAELRPGAACQAARYTIPVHGGGAGFGVVAILVERAARPA